MPKDQLEEKVIKMLHLAGYTKDRILTNEYVKGIGEFDIIVILQKRSLLKKEKLLAIECKRWSSGTFPLKEYFAFIKKCEQLANVRNAEVYVTIAATVPPSKELKKHLDKMEKELGYHGYWQIRSNGEYSWTNSGIPKILEDYKYNF